jgi:hypothetical protein
MNEISKTLSKFIFYMVAAVLLAWTASLTVTFIATALPNMPWYVPYLALVAFDGGMIAWLFVFLKYAEGVIQRATALGLTVFNFAGVSLLVIAEILLGGQTFTEAPQGLATWAIWGIGIWTVANVAGVILFHIGDPSAQKQMSIQNEKDAIWAGALKNLATRRTHNSSALAEELGGRMYDEMIAELFIDRDGDGRADLVQSRRPAVIEAPKENAPKREPATVDYGPSVNGGDPRPTQGRR